MAPTLAAALVTFATAAALTPALAAWARRRRYLDFPNERSSHAIATPRIGGAALVIAVLVGAAVLHAGSAGLGARALFVLAGSVGIAALGLVDDFRQLPALARLSVQVLAAALLVAAVGPVQLPGLPIGESLMALITVLWIVFVTNAYNFMDGIDGIAGAQAVIAGGAWMIVASTLGMPDLSALALLLAAGASGFLLYNWQPARVFMGDAGSGFLGFSFAALPLLATSDGATAISTAVIVLWAFIFDTGATLIRRTLRGENILAAHRSHLYQRLVQTGRSHAYVSIVYSGLALLGAAAAVWLAMHPNASSTTVLLGLTAVAAALWRLVARREARRRAPLT